MQKKVNGIILAAGKGQRLKNFNKPKSLIIKKNKYLIEYIIENFKQNKINKITVVTGYKSKEIKKALKKYKIKFILNKKWKITNMFYIRQTLSRRTSIISYADIFYKSSAIRMLKSIKMTSFKNWKKLWQKIFYQTQRVLKCVQKLFKRNWAKAEKLSRYQWSVHDFALTPKG